MTGAQHTCHARERTFGGGVMGLISPNGARACLETAASGGN